MSVGGGIGRPRKDRWRMFVSCVCVHAARRRGLSIFPLDELGVRRNRKRLQQWSMCCRRSIYSYYLPFLLLLYIQ